jgi:esterase/lipase
MISNLLALLFLIYIGYRVFEIFFSGNNNITQPKSREIIKINNNYTAVIYKIPPINLSKNILIFTIHGFSSNAEFFDSISKKFISKGYSFLGYDLYGHGWSPASKHNCDIELFTKQAYSVLDKYRHNYDKIIILSSSMGTMIHANLIQKYPELSDKNIFVTPSGLGVNLSLKSKICNYPIIGEIMVSLFGRDILISLFNKCYHNKSDAKFDNLIFIDIHRGFLKTLLSINRNMSKENFTYKHIPNNSLVLWSSKDKLTFMDKSKFNKTTKFIDKKLGHSDIISNIDSDIFKYIENEL